MKQNVNPELKDYSLQESRLDPNNWVWTGQRFAYPAPLDTGILLIEKSLQLENIQFSRKIFDWKDVNKSGSGNWGFKGMGTSYDSCGMFYSVGCLNHEPAYVIRKKNNCQRAECPICSDAWLTDSASRLADRIESAKKYHRSRRPIHATASLPANEWLEPLTKEGYAKLRRKANRLMKRVGFQGGVCVFHPYRKKCKKCGAGESEYAKICPKCGSNDWGWIYSPHFHYIGYGWIVGVKSMHEKFGWVIKNIGLRDEVFPVAYYILSHAGIRSGNHTVSWIGTLSWKNYKREYVSEYERPIECPICGSWLQPVKYVGSGENPLKDLKLDKADFPKNDWEYYRGD